MQPASLMKRYYLGPAGAQIHVCSTQPPTPSAPPLYCLHATAYSGKIFYPLMAAMTGRRRVVALDTPGYGASDPLATAIAIPDYAARIGSALQEDAGGQPLDLLGYHTGATLAAEIARQYPDMVRRLVLIGVPYFLGEERDQWRQKLAEPMTLSEDLSQFSERWHFLVTARAKSVSLERGFTNFVDELLAWPDGWRAHDAAFRFSVEDCFPQVTQPALLLNPHNHLAGASRAAANAMPDCQIIELPDLDHAIFDTAPEQIAGKIEAFLDKSSSLQQPASEQIS